jgi:hypothetical protein
MRHASSSGTDFWELDDPEFLAERARVRDRLERTSTSHVITRAKLAGLFEAMNDEFDRRARAAWAQNTTTE